MIGMDRMSESVLFTRAATAHRPKRDLRFFLSELALRRTSWNNLRNQKDLTVSCKRFLLSLAPG
jgi:hypothetical protein